MRKSDCRMPAPFILLSLVLFSKNLVAAPLALETIIPEGLQRPVQTLTAPGEAENLYIVEQPGIVRLLSEDRLSVFLDIIDKVRFGGEMGLLSIAFHPQYATSDSPHLGRFFVNYTAMRVPDTGGPQRLHTIVEEYRKRIDGTITAEKEIKVIRQPFSNHNGGQLAFGPDGFLYIGMGDGGAGGDPQGHAQNPQSLLGKFLRIDVDVEDQDYGIPEGNMFTDPAEGLPEIYASGLRNPWRFSFDPATGRLFTGDVGQDAWEEVHIIEAKRNYGWNTLEGTHCFPSTASCSTDGLELPIWEYPQTQGFSITGGFVYRGSRIAELVGKYVYGDYGSGKIWALTEDETGRWTNETVLNSNLPISSFGVDGNGELLVISHSGALFRIIPESL